MAIRTNHRSIAVDDLESPLRLDVYVSQHCDIPRSVFQRSDTTITLNGKPVKKSRLVESGDHIEVIYTEEYFEGLVAQPIALQILYEDPHLLVINKEQGMVVHPGAGNWQDTVVNALLHRYGTSFADLGESLRPGIVHRLDKDTSGVLAIALDTTSHRRLSEQFKKRSVERVYIALVAGKLSKKSGTIEENIKRHPTKRKEFITCSKEEGRSARTDWTVIKQHASWALVRLSLHTGRTHQIRVHMRSIGHPILGDPIYGSGGKMPLMLHALILGCDHPITGERVRVIAPMPKRFKNALGHGDGE